MQRYTSHASFGARQDSKGVPGGAFGNGQNADNTTSFADLAQATLNQGAVADTLFLKNHQNENNLPEEQ